MFYIKICYFLGNFSRHTLIKIYTKTHKTVPHFPNFPGGELAYAPETPSITCNYN